MNRAFGVRLSWTPSCHASRSSSAPSTLTASTAHRNLRAAAASDLKKLCAIRCVASLIFAAPPSFTPMPKEPDRVVKLRLAAENRNESLEVLVGRNAHRFRDPGVLLKDPGVLLKSPGVL